LVPDPWNHADDVEKDSVDQIGDVDGAEVPAEI
jgi:hypothetical protein